MADDEQVERKEEVAEVRPSLPFFGAAHPVRPDSVRLGRRISCPGVVVLSARAGRALGANPSSLPASSPHSQKNANM